MIYTLKVPAIRGEIVPLLAVVDAMAMRDATAGGTPFHEPTFKGRRTVYILDLLDEVRAGRLAVCDKTGKPLTIDGTVAATEHFGYEMRYVNEPDWEQLHREIRPVGGGVWNLTHVDLGPMEIDRDNPRIGWFSTLKRLNDWAKDRGHAFVLSSDGIGWYDERGLVTPSQTDAPEGLDQTAVTPVIGGHDRSMAWVAVARAIGEVVTKNRKHLSGEQIAQKVHEEMVKRHNAGDRAVSGRGGRVPSAESIKRHALKGIKTAMPKSAKRRD